MHSLLDGIFRLRTCEELVKEWKQQKEFLRCTQTAARKLAFLTPWKSQKEKYWKLEYLPIKPLSILNIFGPVQFWYMEVFFKQVWFVFTVVDLHLMSNVKSGSWSKTIWGSLIETICFGQICDLEIRQWVLVLMHVWVCHYFFILFQFLIFAKNTAGLFMIKHSITSAIRHAQVEQIFLLQASIS